MWRTNRLEPRTSVIVYWVATAVVWIVMLGAYTGHMAIERWDGLVSVTNYR